MQDSPIVCDVDVITPIETARSNPIVNILARRICPYLVVREVRGSSEAGGKPQGSTRWRSTDSARTLSVAAEALSTGTRDALCKWLPFPAAII